MKKGPVNHQIWKDVVGSIQEFVKDPASLRLDTIQWTGSEPVRKAGYHHLLQIVRNWGLINHLISIHSSKSPKPKLKALLSLAIVQILNDPANESDHAKAIHHTVDLTRFFCSPGEAKFVNAICRTISREIEHTLTALETPSKWHIRYSHPKWLVKRWLKQFSEETTHQILKWNQQIPQIYIHISDPLALENAPFDDLTPTEWEGFYRINTRSKAHLNDLLVGSNYIQDPSTRIASSLFENPNPEKILDACAAPGGKLVHLGKQLRDSTQATEIYAADIDDKRLEILNSNLERMGLSENINTFKINWESATFHPNPSFPFDWVLLDAPCTSVGVIQKHPEIRWRLQPEDYDRIPDQQLDMLTNAATAVAPNGELVYSTCSFDPAENEAVIAAFLASEAGADFKLINGTTHLPCDTKHDGVGAFLLKKQR